MFFTRSAWAWALGIFLLAVLVRIPFFPFEVLELDPPNAPTEVKFDGYYEIAENLQSGHGFSRELTLPHTPDSVRTPLYPLFIVSILSLFGSYGALFLIQIFVGSITAVLAWVLAQRYIGNTWWAYGVGVAVALEPLGAYLTGVILTETLFTSLFILSLLLFLLFLRNKNVYVLVFFSVLLGIATLVKPSTQYLPLLCVVIFFSLEKYRLSKKFFLYSLILILFFGATLSPWLYRNHVVFQNINLVVQPVSNMFAYLVPSTIALESGISFEQAKEKFFTQEGVYEIEEINLGNASAFKKRALRELEKHPVGLAKSIGVTLYAFFMNDGYATAFWRLMHQEGPLTLDRITPLLLIVGVGRLFWVLITFLALWGAWVYFKRNGLSPEFIFISGLIAYFALTTAVIGLAVNGRFRIPVDPLLFILAAYALKDVVQKIRIRRSDISKESTVL